MVREETTTGLSQMEALPQNEIEHGQKNVRKLPKKRQNEQLFSFKIVREKRGVHTFIHGE